MLQKAKHTLLNNLSVKLISLFLAYALWTILNTEHRTQITLEVPLSFYNAEGFIIDAPETLSVKLSATRNDLYLVSRKLAAHIDVDTLHEGTQTLTIDNSLLFLPENVKLVRCIPKECAIEVKKA